MGGVEVRRGTQLLGHPGIDDLAGEPEAFEDADALGIGADIHGLGIGVIYVKAQTTGMVAQTELPGVVGAIANTRPGIQRGRLGGEKRVRTLLTVDGRACGDAWPTARGRVSPVSGQVSGGQGGALIANDAIPTRAVG